MNWGAHRTEALSLCRMNYSGLAYYRGGMGGTTMLIFNLFEMIPEL